MSGISGKAPEKMGSSTENLIPGFQPASSAAQADAFGGSSSFTAGSGESKCGLQSSVLHSAVRKQQLFVIASLKGR